MVSYKKFESNIGNIERILIQKYVCLVFIWKVRHKNEFGFTVFIEKMRRGKNTIKRYV